MTLTLKHIAGEHGAKKRRKRVGRGNASGRGTYSTRGVKGQRARSGGRRGLRLLGLKQLMHNVPKKRGFTSPQGKFACVNLFELERAFQSGDVVTPTILVERGVVARRRVGAVKILGKGPVTKKLVVKAHAFSETARTGIEDMGGSVEYLFLRLAARKKKK